jgi:hypothetical protein
MGILIIRGAVLLLLPFAVFASGAYLIAKLSDRQYVTDQLEKLKDDKQPLGLRIYGYNAGEVARHWGALDDKALGFERRSLEIDLLFPFFYGAAFAGALLCAWVALGRPFQPAWLLAPVLIGVVADWIENLVQLSQLRLFSASQEAGLQPGWIQIASVATSVKLALFFLSYFLVIGMVGWMIFSNWPRSPAR